MTNAYALAKRVEAITGIPALALHEPLTVAIDTIHADHAARIDTLETALRAACNAHPTARDAAVTAALKEATQ